MDLTITTSTGGNNYKCITFMTGQQIDDEIFGPPETPFISGQATLTAINEFDEEIILKIKREQIQGYMLAPYHQRVQTVPVPQMAPPNLTGRRQ